MNRPSNIRDNLTTSVRCPFRPPSETFGAQNAAQCTSDRFREAAPLHRDRLDRQQWAGHGHAGRADQPDQTALEERAEVLGDIGLLVTVAIAGLEHRNEAFSRFAFRQHPAGGLDIHETGKAPHVLAFDMSEAHRPLAEIALRDLSFHQRGELRVARITLDLLDESPHRLLGSFEDLEKGVAVEQEHPGHALEMIVDLRLDKQFAHFAQSHGAGRAA